MTLLLFRCVFFGFRSALNPWKDLVLQVTHPVSRCAYAILDCMRRLV